MTDAASEVDTPRDGALCANGSLPRHPDPALRSAWLRALGETDAQVLERRLAWDADAPGQPEDASAARAGLASLRAALAASCGVPLRALARTAQGGSAAPHRPFDDLWWPVAETALQHLRKRVEPRLTFTVTRSAWGHLASLLVDQLCELATPTLWACYQRERGMGVALCARIAAEAAPDRVDRGHYQRFVARHRADALDSLLAEFPVLGRLLGMAVAVWHDAQEEMLLRLAADREALAAASLVDMATLPLVAARGGLSDPHRGGRTVVVLHFGEAADERGVVYKPKDLRLDAAYQHLVADLNQGELGRLKVLNVLCRDGYGYMEHVSHTPCRDADELARFYRNAGRLAALLYVLGCTDCHFENLVACADSLVLIDTETLLEGDIPDPTNSAAERGVALPESGLQRALRDSVSRSGLLPTWRFLGPQKVPVDISALGVDCPGQALQNRQGWLWLNSDAMLPGTVTEWAELPTSSPVAIGQPHALRAHRGELIEGFREQAGTLLARRAAWLRPRGLLSRLSGLPRRLVFRDTSVYSSLREQQLRPEALVGEAAQRLVLEQLARTFLVTAEQPRHWPAFESECAQMACLDIPFFEHSTDGADLVDGTGRTLVRDFVGHSGLAACRDRLARLNDDTVAFQLRLVHGAIDARWPGRATAGAAVPVPTRSHAAAWGRGGRDGAERCLRQLHRQAYLDDDGTPDWLGMELGADSQTACFGAVGLSLYGGSFGVALLQAALGPTNRSVSCHRHILRPLLLLAERADPGTLRRWWQAQPLGLNGAGGILLGLQALDRLGAAPPAGWRSHAEVAARLLDGLTEERLCADGQLDVMGGVAGLVGPLLRSGTVRDEQLARRAGEHLLQRQWAHGGWPQPTPAADARALTGFSHGTAGFAACLCALHRKTGDAQCLEGAWRALAYERSGFDPLTQNWPYLPTTRSTPASMVAWCHGAPGVALGRLCSIGSPLWDATAVAETEVALDTTRRALPSVEHLCCGSAGSVTVLRAAARHLGSPAWRGAAAEMARITLLRAPAAQDRRSRGDAPLSPGLFTGITGVSLVLLDCPAADDCLAQAMSAGLLPDDAHRVTA